MAADFFAPLEAFAALIAARPHPPARVTSFVVYGGGERQRRSRTTVVPWSMLPEVDWS